jgi:hypothetical protein
MAIIQFLQPLHQLAVAVAVLKDLAEVVQQNLAVQVAVRADYKAQILAVLQVHQVKVLLAAIIAIL